MMNYQEYTIENGKNQLYTTKVPFVEISPDGSKLQGVVSSGSSKTRVYVCVINKEAGTYTCHTNNNRQCGGLRGDTCSHLRKLLKQGSSTLENGSKFSFGGLSPDGKARYGEVFTRYLRLLKITQQELMELPIYELNAYPMEVRK